jgi:hypothetical protein
MVLWKKSGVHPLSLNEITVRLGVGLSMWTVFTDCACIAKSPRIVAGPPALTRAMTPSTGFVSTTTIGHDRTLHLNGGVLTLNRVRLDDQHRLDSGPAEPFVHEARGAELPAHSFQRVDDEAG